MLLEYKYMLFFPPILTSLTNLLIALLLHCSPDVKVTIPIYTKQHLSAEIMNFKIEMPKTLTESIKSDYVRAC